MIGRALRFAWLRVRREPGRTALAVLGVTAIGALLFDMLLLSNGLLVSFRDRLDKSGFDVRVMSGDSAVITGPPIERTPELVAALRRLPAVAAVQRVSLGSADVEGRAASRRIATVGCRSRRPRAVGDRQRPRTAVDADALRWLAVNRNMARLFGLENGAPLVLRGRCGGTAAPLPLSARVSGVADFQNDAADALTAAMSFGALGALCGGTNGGSAPTSCWLTSARGRWRPPTQQPPPSAREAPSFSVVTNAQLVDRVRPRRVLVYFRQVVQRADHRHSVFRAAAGGGAADGVGEPATRRDRSAEGARSCRGRRVMAGVVPANRCCSSASAAPPPCRSVRMLVAVARRNPARAAGHPGRRAFLRLHAARGRVARRRLMADGAAAAAALYPMRLVAVLPVAATLRRETGS